MASARSVAGTRGTSEVSRILAMTVVFLAF
jgi:hypothetical protein